MTLARTNTWAFGQKLTSDQINAVDANVVNALDKRSGQTDTLASAVTVTGATTFSGTTAINGAMTVTAPIVTSNTITTTSGIVFNSGNTVTGNMHLAGTETVDSGGLITVASGGGFTLQAGSTNTLTGATITGGTFVSSTITSPVISDPTVSGTMSGGTLSGTTLSSPTLYGTMSGGFITGMDMTLASGHVLNLDSGSVITRAGTNALMLVGVGSSRLATHITSSSTSWATMNTNPSIGVYVAMTCEPGDILIVDSTMQATNAGGNTFLKIVVGDPGVNGGVSQDISAVREIASAAPIGDVSFHFAYTVVGTGIVSIVGRVLVDAGTATVWGTDQGAGDATLRVLQYRP